MTLLQSLPVACILLCATVVAEDQPAAGIFSDDNLVAWCIVPFDAKARGPAERAGMLVRLGLKHVAYDWRAEHVPSFEEEILQYKKHNLDFFAFWSWHDSMEPLIRQHGIRPQIWLMMANSKADTQEARVQEAVNGLLPMVQKTRELGLKLGIYNHGGWAGQPQNMVEVAENLRTQHDADHVGIVYNFHHGHEHIADFRKHLTLMKPLLLCVNINGMADADVVAAGRNKILPVGSGQHERQMLALLRDSGYSGPVGILDHRSELDAEESLRANLNGLRALRGNLMPAP
ncbi:MAG: TIM barrel protein [Fuerstiella sp.]